MAPNHELKRNPVKAKSYRSPFSYENRTKGNAMLSQSRQTLSMGGVRILQVRFADHFALALRKPAGNTMVSAFLPDAGIAELPFVDC
jgi:hypothetical protein